MSEDQGAAVAVQEQQPATAAKAAKKGHAGTGNYLLDVATEVEGLTKTKALNLAESLASTIDENYFRLGGVLKLISENSWFEGFDSFDAFVMEKFGFQSRKARYLISIYTELVTKQIPWDVVKGLGWTKLKDLAPLLTPENVAEWVEKVKNLSYLEMMAVIKGVSTGTGGASGSTSDDVTTIKFKLKPDQVEVVTAALSKAKGELGTEFDNVALENICAGYVAGTVAAAGPTNTAELFKAMGWEAVLTAFGEVFPNIDITVDPNTAAA